MATLVFSALGGLIGGPIGAAIGALAGRQVDSLVFKPGTREGPRLNDLPVTTSSYGMPIPRQFGRMRVAGSIIWATDLIEHRDQQGNGKGRPSTTSYSYSASFAVALSSRPITGIGRIWADGKLLRGAAGDMKLGGTLRLHTGHRDQAVDPLIAAAEGVARTPAFRGLAYAVFEDLQLADFGNRIPALTFEVLADPAGFTLAAVVDGVLEEVDAAVPLGGIAGLSAEGTLIDLLQSLDPLVPMDCDASQDRLLLAPARLQSQPQLLPEATTASDDGDFGGNNGFTRHRGTSSEPPLAVLRYYDIGRDYQPGTQRAAGQPLPGQPRTIELPAALEAHQARKLIETSARRAQWSRQRLSWRIAQLDPAIGPGSIVTVPDQPGRWVVREWEWRASGIELALERLAPITLGPAMGDSGNAVLAPDLQAVPTVLAAFELPWDGTGSSATTQLFAAVSASASHWAGAALYVDQGDGQLLPLGPSGRSRSVIGSAETVLFPRNPLLFDRDSTVEITLISADLSLANATMRQLTMGANRALLGEELLQFMNATPLGHARWRLSGLWRGRGGTEGAVDGHLQGETFILLDGSAVPLDADRVGTAPLAEVLALGLGDSVPVSTMIALRGSTLRPHAPVHGSMAITSADSIRLSWVRRARGAWLWQDASEAPLGEATETYEVVFADAATTQARWISAQPQLEFSAAELAVLSAALPNGQFQIRQLGDRAASAALVIRPHP